MNWVLKKDIDNAPPCNLTPRTIETKTAEITKTSMIPVSRNNVNTQRSKTPDNTKRRPVSVTTPRSFFLADPHQNYTQKRSLSSTSLKRKISSSSFSSRLGIERPGSTVNSCESLADTLPDNEQWLMKESHLDISKVLIGLKFVNFFEPLLWFCSQNQNKICLSFSCNI